VDLLARRQLPWWWVADPRLGKQLKAAVGTSAATSRFGTMTPAIEIIFAIGLIIGFGLDMASAHLFHFGDTKRRDDDAHSNASNFSLGAG
jgi:hypothetical protein